MSDNPGNAGPQDARPIISSLDRNVKSIKRSDAGAGATNGLAMSSTNANISVAVDPVALITTECITVTSAMRKNVRWAHSSVSAILGGSPTPLTPGLPSPQPSTPRDELRSRKGPNGKSSSGLAEAVGDGGLANRWGLRGKKGKSMQDNPLMAGFGRLRHELNACKGIKDLFPDYSSPDL